MRQLLNQHRARATRRIAAAEAARAPAAAAALHGLSPHALALASTTIAQANPQVNLVLPNADLSQGYAGVSTAWKFGAELARSLELPMRLISLDPRASGAIAAAEGIYGGVLTSHVGREGIGRTTFGSEDVWIATHWTTAHALSIATRYGSLDVSRCVYLVQDFEPGFSAWSTHFAVAESTYRAGFITVVNSTPVAHYLSSSAGIQVDDALVFAPAIETTSLRVVAQERRDDAPLRVAFYGRPTKPRNLYDLGIAALRLTARSIDHPERVQFVSVGEATNSLSLSKNCELKSVGRLALGDYFEFLASTQVVLSLQHSPHPSHPPLDAAVSGALAVTNRFGPERAALHRRITAVEATPEALSVALSAAIAQARAGYDSTFESIPEGILGRPMIEVINEVSTRLSS